ncbi:MAG TPA: outer membrane beta-barrel protein [Bacteroidia bacterium]|jgi:hypothetical protein|nr:outer membrane beta-barrel protein [Bacteroidia bacterium]
MIDKNDDIVDLFKSVVEPFELAPPEESWPLLDLELERRKNENYRRILLRFKIASLVLLILLMSSILFQFYHSGKETKYGFPFADLRNRKSTAYLAKPDLPLIKDKVELGTSNINKNIFQNSYDSKSKEEIIIKTINKYHAPLVTNQKQSVSGLKTGKQKYSAILPITTVPNHTGRATDLSASQQENNSMFADTNIYYLQSSGPLTKPLPDTTIVTKPLEIVDVTQKNEPFLDSLNTKKESANSRLTAYLFFSPDYTKQSIVDNHNVDNQSEADYKSSESPDFSFTTGMKCNYSFNRKWGMQSGLTYSYFSQYIKPVLIFASNGSDGSPHYALPTSYGIVELPNSTTSPSKVGDSLYLKSDSRQVIQFINLPILLTYKLGGNKLSYYLMAGASLNMVISEKAILDEQGTQEIIHKVTGLREFNQSLIVGAGIEYSPKNRFCFRVEPTFKRNITPVNKNNPVSTYPYSFGIAFCLGFRF